MQKVYIKLLLFLISISCVSGEDGHEYPLVSKKDNNECQKDANVKIEQLYNQYRVEFIKALLVTDFALFYYNETVDCCDISRYSYEIHYNDIHRFRTKANEYVKILTENERTDFLLTIEKWLKVQEVLFFPFHLNMDANFEFSQIISKIDKTKHLVQKHLSIESQYWGSLSSSQNACLNLEVVTFVSELDQKDMISFLAEYFTLISDYIE